MSKAKTIACAVLAVVLAIVPIAGGSAAYADAFSEGRSNGASLVAASVADDAAGALGLSASSSLSAQSTQYADAYRDVITEWRLRITRDKSSSNGFDYNTAGMTRTCSPKYVSSNKGKTGDAFVYGYADLGISEIPAMIVADPDSGYMTYGIYQCYESGGEYRVAYFTSHFRYWKYACSNGYLRARTNHPAMGVEGRSYNMSISVERARLQGNEYLAFDEVESVSYSSGRDYYRYTDANGATTFFASGAGNTLARITEEHPIDTGITWHGVFDDFVAPEVVTITERKMYRAYNPNSGEHFYTYDSAEFGAVVGAGWKYEGIGWTAPETSNTPVYRLYNKYGGEHHYCTDKGEHDALVAAGWADEGIGWYSDDAKSVPLYREYNPNAFANNHNYTTSKEEHEWLLSLGWKDEGRAWYGVK